MQDTLINHKRDVLVQHKVQSSAIQSDLDELAKRKVCDTILAFFQVFAKFIQGVREVCQKGKLVNILRSRNMEMHQSKPNQR